jgi:hypothetical protein
LKLTIENKFGENPTREEIGMGQKIRSKYTNLLMKTLEEKEPKETTSKLPFQKYKTFKKEFYLPLE